MVPLFFIPRHALVALVTVACASVAAPVVAPSARPDPSDARAPVPSVQHRSALTGYRGLTDVPAVPWRDANDTVARIGGWRSYAREASAAQAPASAPASAPMPHKH